MNRSDENENIISRAARTDDLNCLLVGENHFSSCSGVYRRKDEFAQRQCKYKRLCGCSNAYLELQVIHLHSLVPTVVILEYLKVYRHRVSISGNISS